MRLGLGRACRLAGVWLCAACLAGCASRLSLDPTETAGLPRRAELADTPFHPQTRYQCGPAALATVLNVAGIAVSPDALVDQVYLPARQGSLQVELVATARRYGLLAVPIDPGIGALLAEIAAGHPVLVLQNLGLDALPRWHYAVAIGYDLDRETLILRSGTDARRATPLGVFEATWARGARWGLVVLAPGQMPARAQPGAYLEAAAALEASGQHQAAHTAYAAATTRWPAEPLAWFGLGNAAFALGDAEAAEQALRRAIRLRPGMAAAWNNLAYALAARRCSRAAREAAACATRLAPGDTRIAHTRAGMAALRDPAAPCAALASCPVP